jgi:hypothetical protein
MPVERRGSDPRDISGEKRDYAIESPVPATGGLRPSEAEPLMPGLLPRYAKRTNSSSETRAMTSPAIT